LPSCGNASGALRYFADDQVRGIADHPNMTMTATARSVDGGPRHEVDVNSRHAIVTDEPESLGGTNEGPAPHELLPAMLASCASTMITFYARARNWELSPT
jgi:uncharacterized OsmC-like protein